MKASSRARCSAATTRRRAARSPTTCTTWATVGSPSWADRKSRSKAKKVKLLPSDVTFAPRYHAEEGKAYAERWLKIARSRAPTAVVLANDTMALGFMRTLHAQSVGIPSEVSVVGFDDIPAAS